MSDQWFVHSNGEQMGPYTGEQMVQYAIDGNITGESMVWAEGMAEWAPASQIPGLMPEAAAPAPAATVVAAKPATGAGWNPHAGRALTSSGGALGGSAYKPGTSALTSKLAPVGGDYPHFPVKPASFALWLCTFLGGFILFFIAIVTMIAGVVAAAKGEAAGTGGEAGAAAGLGGGSLLLFVGWVVSMVSMVVFCIYLYRAWFCLQPGGAKTTPGKAIGLMFIPFFNLYWLFVAINGLPKDWNRIVSSYEDLKTAPRLSETTFLLYCIGIFFAPLGIIMIFPMMSQLCKGINFFASRRNPNAPTSAFSAFGRR